MPVVPPAASLVPCRTAIAALLLAAVPRLKDLDLAHPAAADVIAATEVSSSRAYELKARLEAQLTDLVHPTGRPPKPPQAAPPPSISQEVLDFVFRHPGCVSGPAHRHQYSVSFQLFALELAERHPDVEPTELAAQLRIPLGTLKDWLRCPPALARDDHDHDNDEGARSKAPTALPQPTGPQIETVLAEWELWDGTFVDFCHHLQAHCGIPFGRTLIAHVLEASGVRLRKRRAGRSPDEQALRDQFVTFFPNAQWVGDGTELSVEFNGNRFRFNLELHVDPYSGAFLGADIRPNEDSAALIDAFHDAEDSAGTRPLALLLDNKPSNHTDDVDDALGDTLLLRATPYRAQNKAHIEGGFGLLKPTLGEIEVDATTPTELARQILVLLVTVWGRTVNHRPRADRGGRSRVDLHQEHASLEQIEQAREALQERLRRQEKRRQTLAARQDPIVRAVLTAAFERLGLEDPNGHWLIATARYPLNAVVDGIAIFDGKRRAGTLPDDVDVRYLWGIVRRIANEREGWEIACALWEGRVAAGDIFASRLQRQLDRLTTPTQPPEAVLKLLVDQAMKAPSRFERFFWLTAIADVIAARPTSAHANLFRLAARRIHATHTVRHRERLEATRLLADRLRPLR